MSHGGAARLGNAEADELAAPAAVLRMANESEDEISGAAARPATTSPADIEAVCKGEQFWPFSLPRIPNLTRGVESNLSHPLPAAFILKARVLSRRPDQAPR